jgi:hypothetical protein
MNELIYKARMALKDVMEVKISSQGGGRVYLSFFPDLFWAGAERARAEKVVQNIFDCLHDMDMDLAGGESAVPALLRSEPVEIVHRSA